jgi:DNA-binding transcriptional MerR regulator
LAGSGAGEPPVKLYYRIGEVANIVGVEPHVLRYWETEFRSIRPQKSKKGQRVYSRRDVEKLLRVKDLLYAQGFTIAGHPAPSTGGRSEGRERNVSRIGRRRRQRLRTYLVNQGRIDVHG